MFKKKKLLVSTNSVPTEYEQALNFNKQFRNLLSLDKYLARSDYKYLLDNFSETYSFFNSLSRANTLLIYCKQYRLVKKELLDFLSSYENIKNLKEGSEIIKKHNEAYILDHLLNEKQYLDNILKKIDDNILLDNEQRRAILSDEDYSLIIAGAGAGKTTTVAAKVRYLIEKKHINPDQILVISFTNKAVSELKERINLRLSIPCPITTFHSAGYAILRKQSVEKKQVVNEGFLFDVVNNYLKRNILQQPDLVDKLILFFGSYFDTPYDGNDINMFFNYIAKADFSTLRSNSNDYITQIVDRRTGNVTTITNEVLRSVQEVRIANYLYLNNIDYIYEEIYPYHILKAKKPYTPDFCIKQGDKKAYIEHFGITEAGTSNFYTEEQLSLYKKEIHDKIALHKKHNTCLIYTFSKYNDGRDLIEHLEEQLMSNGFALKKRSSEEIFNKIINTEENRYILKLVKLICVFITNFKINGYTINDFYRFERTNTNIRTKLFFSICKECLYEYQKKLEENNAIDFQDMINDSARIIREKQFSKEKLDFRYIIVDEYQDISKQRFDLTKELSTLCNAKIIAVGDDWQSIYAFSGSDVTLFTHFCDIMGYGEELKITHTYRNAQEVIDIAGNFIQKNEKQIKKDLKSPKHIIRPVIINTYSEEVDREKTKGAGGKNYNLGKKVEEIIGEILRTNKVEGKDNNSTILLIGRYGFDARNLCFSKDFIYDEKNNILISKKYKSAKLEFLTAHSSKGLGKDNVIIINAKNELYGFPSKIDDDPVMQYVVKDDKSIDYAEERRLFYVALTRTKNRVYIVTPEQRPSEFILELINDYPNITLKGEINKTPEIQLNNIKRCPICGYPLQLRWKKNYGLRLWMCTNEPEICNFITNDLKGEDFTIQKCDSCQNGYLIVKQTTKGSYMLGCTNYKKDGTGCNRTMNHDYYLRWRSNDFEMDSSSDKPRYEIDFIPKLPDVTKKPIVNPDAKRRESPTHVTQTKMKFIEKDGFNVIADDEGQLITDMKLLVALRSLRNHLSLYHKRPAYTIITNKGLVSLATFRPTTREEYIKLYGLGESSFQTFGQDFIDAIIEYGKTGKK